MNFSSRFSRLLSGLVLTLCLFACGEAPNPATDPAPAASAQEKTPNYPTTTVSLEDVERPLRITGRVVPLQESVISSQVPGKVLPTRKLLQEGKYYRKGEIMVRIDDEALRYRLQADRANLVTSLVRVLSDLSIDYPAEHPTWEAFTKTIQPEEVLPTLPSTENEQLRYFISAQGIPAQYYAIRAQEATLDDYVVTAPFSGKLTRASVEPGTVVQPGQQLATISRTDVYEVRAAVLAASVPQLKIGQRLQLTAANLGTTYTGTINRYGTAIDQATQTVTAFVRLSGEQLREGLYLEAELPGESLKAVAVLPKEALTRDGGVHLIEEGTVVLREVTPVLIEADKVYLRGLTDGDRVITAAINRPIVGTAAR
ncbi:MAG: efflux RND transporter periplasmic adaptor subunit [Bacteroidota bacterium]